MDGSPKGWNNLVHKVDGSPRWWNNLVHKVDESPKWWNNLQSTKWTDHPKGDIIYSPQSGWINQGWRLFTVHRVDGSIKGWNNLAHSGRITKKGENNLNSTKWTDRALAGNTRVRRITDRRVFSQSPLHKEDGYLRKFQTKSIRKHKNKIKH